LKAVRLINDYHKELAVKLSLNDLFIHTTIEAQAKLILASKKNFIYSDRKNSSIGQLSYFRCTAPVVDFKPDQRKLYSL